MAPRLSSVFEVAMLLVVLTSLAAVDAAAVKPTPLVLKPAATKPKPNKLDVDISGGGAPTPLQLPPLSVANYVLYSPCTNLDKALVTNPAYREVQQCAAYSTYDFGIFATNAHTKDAALRTGGYAINYIDALYVVFGECIADSTKANIVETNSAPAVKALVPAVNALLPAVNTPPATSGAAHNVPLGLLVGAVAVCALVMGL